MTSHLYINDVIKTILGSQLGYIERLKINRLKLYTPLQECNGLDHSAPGKQSIVIGPVAVNPLWHWYLLFVPTRLVPGSTSANSMVGGGNGQSEF